MTLVLPLRAILFQVLFLLLAIALEAMIFRWKLKLQRRNSIQVATVLNLLSALVGWVVFLGFLGFMSAEMKLQWISYLFFDQSFGGSQRQGANTLLVWLAFLTFFASFLLEWIGFSLLEYWAGQLKAGKFLGLPIALQEQPTTEPNRRLKLLPKPFKVVVQTDWIESSFLPRANAILWANAVSYSAILALLAIRFVERHYFVGWM